MTNVKDREYYLQIAEKNLSTLYEKKISVACDVRELYRGDTLVLDLGNHYVGYFSFLLGHTDRYPDAPARLQIKFCETREELDADFSAYKGGLCASWLQEETVTIDYVGAFDMPRRYAARYIKITVLAAPKRITLSDFVFSAVTSADVRRLAPCNVADPCLGAIDAVAVNTLKNCMQRVFEDGPKRDRRLWIGDLRLEALTNSVTFDQSALVRRCLYLFAAAECDENGFLPAYVYETPTFVSGTWFLRDYALLFVATLCDYVLHTGDRETFGDLYPIAKRQMEAILRETDERGIVVARNNDNVFIDWHPELKKTAALHGVYLYTLSLLCQTLQALEHEDEALYRGRYQTAREAARRYLYNEEENEFTNEYDGGQLSVHAVAWLILGGVAEGEGAWRALRDAMAGEEGLKPVTPYMHHYLVEAMMKLGKREEAMAHVKRFWGLMVERGADTFWEVFVPDDPNVSPYGDRMINSMCHAWSCTPSYFIRTIGQ